MGLVPGPSLFRWTMTEGQLLKLTYNHNGPETHELDLTLRVTEKIQRLEKKECTRGTRKTETEKLLNSSRFNIL